MKRTDIDPKEHRRLRVLLGKIGHLLDEAALIEPRPALVATPKPVAVSLEQAASAGAARGPLGLRPGPRNRRSVSVGGKPGGNATKPQEVSHGPHQASARGRPVPPPQRPAQPTPDIPFCQATAAASGGWVEALVLRQTHDLATLGDGVTHHGYRYTPQTLGQWQSILPVISTRTIQRVMARLVKRDLLTKRRWLGTTLYRVNYPTLAAAIISAGWPLPLWLPTPVRAQMSMLPDMEAISILGASERATGGVSERAKPVAANPTTVAEVGTQPKPAGSASPAVTRPYVERPGPVITPPRADSRADDDDRERYRDINQSSLSVEDQNPQRVAAAPSPPELDGIHPAWIAKWLTGRTVASPEQYVRRCAERERRLNVDLSVPPADKIPANGVGATHDGTVPSGPVVASSHEKNAPAENWLVVEDIATPMDEQWREVLGVLEKIVARPSFETFLRHTKGHLREQGFMVLSPSSFAAEYLTKRMRGVIQRAVDSVMGEPIDVQFHAVKALAEGPGEDT